MCRAGDLNDASASAQPPPTHDMQKMVRRKSVSRAGVVRKPLSMQRSTDSPFVRGGDIHFNSSAAPARQQPCVHEGGGQGACCVLGWRRTYGRWSWIGRIRLADDHWSKGTSPARLLRSTSALPSMPCCTRLALGSAAIAPTDCTLHSALCPPYCHITARTLWRGIQYTRPDHVSMSMSMLHPQGLPFPVCRLPSAVPCATLPEDCSLFFMIQRISAASATAAAFKLHMNPA